MAFARFCGGDSGGLGLFSEINNVFSSFHFYQIIFSEYTYDLVNTSLYDGTGFFSDSADLYETATSSATL